ncbi:MAG: hypothetical protein HQL16_05830 [Candidatus Omnitrophica bacterium]|nr:hypothetical protein [Candidatus Omnitrophota bacterium]
MPRRKSTKKKIPQKNAEDWHLKVAFALGRTVKKASQKISKAKASSKGRLKRKRSSQKSITIHRPDPFSDIPQGPMSPILKELKAIFDVSGLTRAVEEMNEIGLKHSSHPVVNRLVEKLQQLSPGEQEALSRRFIARLQESPYFNNAIFAMPPKAKMTEEECQKISDAFIECVTGTLEDIGMTREEGAFLKEFSDDVTRPLNDLLQFYLHPKTFGQKVKRLWRMQRIVIKIIKIIHISNRLARENVDFVSNARVAPAAALSDYWQNIGSQPIVIKEKSLKI